jgi:protein-L-isoaspartate O-methyltransferase
MQNVYRNCQNKAEKKNMLLLQLEMRGVTNEVILKAFASIDREDFVPQQFRRMAYQDMETQIIGANRIMLRPYILAKIATYVNQKRLKAALIIGDTTGYTSAILSHIFESIVVGSVTNSEAEAFPENIDKVRDIKLIEGLLLEKSHWFDFIFFDSGYYKISTIKKALTLLSSSGEIIYFMKNTSFDFSLSKFKLSKVNINSMTNFETKTVFTENIHISEDFVR